jgi:hypothetical protein
MDAPLGERERLKLQIIARAQLPLAEQRAELEDSLISFVEGAWSSLDPLALSAIVGHRRAVRAPAGGRGWPDQKAAR